MKDLFPEFYEPDFDALWKDAIIVFDASALLNLYKYPKQQLENIFAQLELVKDRLWLPNQVGYEYQNGREKLIERQHDAYKNITRDLVKVKKEVEHLEKTYSLHPDEKLEAKALIRPIIDIIQNTIDSISSKNHKKPSDLVTIQNDPIIERLSMIFANRIGAPFTYERLDEISIEGEKRDKNKVPPGFNDNGNGDLIIWFQIIEYAIEHKALIIFVSDDVKNDWVDKGRPRVELRREMYQKASNDFWIYNTESFFKEGNKRGILTVQPETIETAEEIAENAMHDRIRQATDTLAVDPKLLAAIRKIQKTTDSLSPDPKLLAAIRKIQKATDSLSPNPRMVAAIDELQQMYNQQGEDNNIDMPLQDTDSSEADS